MEKIEVDMIIVGYLEYLEEVEFNSKTLRQSFSAEGFKPSQIYQVTECLRK